MAFIKYFFLVFKKDKGNILIPMIFNIKELNNKHNLILHLRTFKTPIL